MSKNELSFKEGYELLKKNASLLESQEEPDIDNLMKKTAPKAWYNYKREKIFKAAETCL